MARQESITDKLDLKDTGIIRGFKCATKTGNYTVTNADSFTLLVANNASTDVEFTLPTTTNAKGCVFFFASLGAAGMTITGGTADKMVTLNEADADKIAFTTNNQKIGAAAIVICDGTNYYVFDCSAATITPTD